MRIALAGNPNSGKTTLYNALTGKNEKVGNWAGVTVEERISDIKKVYSNQNITIVDLPGAYSMSPFTNEESITSLFVKNQNPDVIINIVDATNLSRSLFFTTQLLELGIPVVIALNKNDINEKKKTEINTKLLGNLLDCEVLKTVAIANDTKGLTDLIKKCESVVGKQQNSSYKSESFDITNKKEVEKADLKRYDFVNSIVEKVEKRVFITNEVNLQDKIDTIVANKWFGVIIFAIIMYAVFAISQTYLGTWISEYLVGLVESFQEYLKGVLQNASPFLSSLLVDGIIGGFGAVIGFLPLVMVMYFLIALLEDCGYMARVAVVMDRFFKRVGLSGKSIIPMVIGTGCAIPGIMACRTIKDERERRTTAMLTPFMPCGAKLPIIGLFAGVFFKDATWVGTLMYFMGVVLIFISADMIQRINGHKFRKSFFILELPEYKWPSLKLALKSTLSRAKAFIIKAGTIILVCNAAVQIMQTFNWNLEVVEEGMESTSILASIASPFAILLIPLGFGIWQLAAAAITGFIAKENVVGTLAVVYGITKFIDTDSFELLGGANEVANVIGISSVVALSYLVFNLFTPPCFAAIGAMNAEIKNKKWLFAGIGLQFSMAYVTSFTIYQLGTYITIGKLGVGFIPGLILCLLIISVFVGLIINGNKKALAYKLESE
ncbi:MAG: ferrous iron transport protein B [Erysipelotrichaceae bacterium]